MRGRQALWLLAVSLLPYLNALPNGFALDDHGLVEGHRAVADLDLGGLFARDYWWGFEGRSSGLYRPLPLLTFGVERALFGLRPLIFHLHNVLLHGAVTLLALALLRRVVGAGVALIAALLFAVLPGHSEAVCAIAGRADLLAAAASLLCLWILLARPPTAAWAAAAALAFALALLSKEQAVVVPILAACLHHLQGFRAGRGRALPWRPYAALAAVLAAYLAARTAVLGGLAIGAVEPLDNPLVLVEGPARFAAALAVLPRYLLLLALPAHLSADYSHAAIPVTDLPPLQLAAGAALALLSAALLVRFARRPDVPGLAAAWVVVCFAPVANLLVTIGTILAERLTYLPSVGFALGVGWVLEAGRARLGERTWRAGVAALLIVLAVRTAVRCGDWRDDASLFAAAVRVVPHSARAHEGLGSALRQRGQLAAAEVEYRRAVELYRRYDTAHYNLGLVLYDTARYGEALGHFERACALRPTFAEAHLNRGAALQRLGRLGEAAAAYREAARLRPGWDAAQRNLRAVVIDEKGER